MVMMHSGRLGRSLGDKGEVKEGTKIWKLQQEVLNVMVPMAMVMNVMVLPMVLNAMVAMVLIVMVLAIAH